MNRRLLGLAASIVLATLGTFVLLSYVRGAEQRAIAGEQTIDVLVVSDTIRRGTPAAEIGAKVKIEQVPAKVQVPGSLATLEPIDGLVAAVDLVPGEQLLSTRFVATEALQVQNKLQPPEGLLEVTLSLSPDRAVGGQPIPGDTVAVVASFDPFPFTAGTDPGATPGTVEGSTQTTNTTHIILHKVLVTNVQVEELPKKEDQSTDPLAHDLAPTGNLLVTLAMDAPSVERALFAAEHGTVWLALEPQNAVENGTQIQTIVTVYE